MIKHLGKGGGTALPGLLAYRLNKKLLPHLSQQLSGSIVVSGTNGKTTTSRLIASFIEGSNQSLVHNRTGSNLTRGILSALIAEADWRGRIKAQWGVFEVDEAVFAEVVTLIQPQYVLASNLFRDQLDRYGEIATLAKKWKEACHSLTPQTTLIVNADDPLMASLATGVQASVVTYGVQPRAQKGKRAELAMHADSRRCPECGGALVFSQINYSHLGVYTCVNGDFERPEPTHLVSSMELQGMEGSVFEFQSGQGPAVKYVMPLAGLYNIYNAAAALSLAHCMQLDTEMLQHRLKGFEAVFGRLEQVAVGDTTITLILVKNPTGYNQVIQTLQTEPSASTLWLLLNDKFADGRDISWIWDIELEALKPQAQQVIVSGTRALDMAVRAKYANIESSQLKVAPGLAEGLRTVLSLKESHVYCLCTYTAMLELRQLLQKDRRVRSYYND